MTRTCSFQVSFSLAPPYQILGKTGGKVTDFHDWQGYRAGSWTDDTGMTLAVCRAFIDMARNGKTLEDAFKLAFHNWAGSDESRRAGKILELADELAEALGGSG